MSANETSDNSSRLPKNDKSIIRILTIELREELKRPQGLLIAGSFKETMKTLKELVEKEKPPAVISVGDIISMLMLKFGLAVDTLIVDNKTMRKKISPIVVDSNHTLYAKNPSGTITNEAWNIIRTALKLKGLKKIIIEGEEDLLTIVAVLSAPNDAFVVYGQPNVGVVVIKVNGKKKKDMQKILDSMKETSKS